MIFIHFEPTGHALGKNESGYFYVKEDNEQEQRKVRGGSGSGSRKDKTKDVDKQYREDSRQGYGGQSASYGGLPPYIKRE